MGMDRSFLVTSLVGAAEKEKYDAFPVRWGSAKETAMARVGRGVVVIVAVGTGHLKSPCICIVTSS